MAEQPSGWSHDRSGAHLLAELIRVAMRTAQLMQEIAASRERVAASYRLMAMSDRARRPRYLQHAAALEHSARRARRFAEHEKQQVTIWQQRRDSRRSDGSRGTSHPS